MADPETGMLHLAQALKAMRLQRGHSQTELALLAGVPRLKVVHIEAGRPTVSIGAYARVAAAMGAELGVVLQQRPTMDEIRALIGDGND
jgi:transcriptional regulator with XRE-family HTH domain